MRRPAGAPLFLMAVWLTVAACAPTRSGVTFTEVDQASI